MFFRRDLKFAAVRAFLGTALVLAGCGLNTGEDPPGQVPPAFGANGYSCVSEIPDHLDRYFNDRLAAGEITRFMRCLQKSFTSFAQLTRGRDRDTYSPEEIRRFLQDNFLRNRAITDQLLHQFMIIKRLLVGGSVDRISRADLQAVVEVLEVVRVEALRLKPHLRILNPKLADHQPPDKFAERLAMAKEALLASSRVFADRLQTGKVIYTYSDFQIFLVEFRRFVEWERHFKRSKHPRAWVEMLAHFKTFAISPEFPDGIGSEEWPGLLQNMSRWYLAYVQYRAGVKDKVEVVESPQTGEWTERTIERRPLLWGTGLHNLVFLTDEVFRLLEESVSDLDLRPNRVITFDQILDVVKSMQELGWVHPRIRISGIRRVLSRGLARIFGDPRATDEDRSVGGLTPEVLASMKADFERWAQVQLRLDRVYRSHRRPAPDVPALQIKRPDGTTDQSRAINDDSNWSEFQKLADQSRQRPLFSESDSIPFVVLAPESQLADFGVTNGFVNLSRLNFLRAGVTMAFRGYARSGVLARLDSGISQSELQRFYLDFRRMGIDLGIIDSRQAVAGDRSFIEGNLFTYSADGLRTSEGSDGLLNFREAVELTAFLYSGGKSATAVYNRLATICPATGPTDLRGDPMIDRCCVYERLKEALVDTANNMPNWQSYFKSLDAAQRDDYILNLMNVAFSRKFSYPDWVEYNEFSSMTTILHYAEAIMTRYDRNPPDGRIDNREILAKDGVFSVFSGYIEKFIDENVVNLEWARKHIFFADTFVNYLTRRAFLFILDQKRIPDVATVSDLWSLMDEQTAPKLSLDRGDLAKVFSVIVGRLTQAQPGVASVPRAVLEGDEDWVSEPDPTPVTFDELTNAPVDLRQCRARKE